MINENKIPWVNVTIKLFFLLILNLCSLFGFISQIEPGENIKKSTKGAKNEIMYFEFLEWIFVILKLSNI